MHVYFSGIGGAGIGPLALIAHKAGYQVSGSDKQDSSYISYLKEHGIHNIHIGQSYEQIARIHEQAPIDWFVYSSALVMEQPDAPELKFCADQHIKTSKRDEFLNLVLQEKQLRLIAIAGTHGKTTTTAMLIWLFKQCGVPLSYSVGAKLSFGDMGDYDPAAKYFVYEADEFDRNFLAFQPFLSLVTGIDWDHPDIYPTREAYNAAFREFLEQCAHAVMWDADVERLGLSSDDRQHILNETDPEINHHLHLAGLVNRQNAWEVIQAWRLLFDEPSDKELYQILNNFPGLSRRFEKLVSNLYTDYAHTPGKIRGALELAEEIAANKVVVIYEGLHNTRQHFIKDELAHLFDEVKELYIVPTYLAREDPNLPLLNPADLRNLVAEPVRSRTHTADLNNNLIGVINKHRAEGDLVLALTAGGGHSLDEWLRRQFTDSKT